MHVSWFWIKQRPQFVAEELSKYYNVTVACLEDSNKDKLREASIGKPYSLQSIRLFKRNNPGVIFSHINYYLKKLQLVLMMRPASIIWVTTPTQFLHIQNLLRPTHKVVYDCMDNMAEFHNTDPVMKQAIIGLEGQLCERADLIITSSNVLQQRIQERFETRGNTHVVNNGISENAYFNNASSELPASMTNVFNNKQQKYFLYIGTISHWFDFESLLECVDELDGCTFILVGPAEVNIPLHKSIIHIPPVQHAFIRSIMQAADALIMPFKITDLIKAVNPVKAYEYISSGKPVILSAYEETRAFENFAFLYTDKASFKELIKRCIAGELNAKQERVVCEMYANSNTWTIRGNKIEELLRAL